ncbi:MULTISPECIES: hypothetical protein [Bacillus]|uniref:hypothetical protein n=1 Tax=Bacillus TaxID=1386 RepID=UPI00016B8CAC|nr:MULTISPECIES: hypothetical protein [Bacillus]EDX65292.1 hypothetical protein BC059799_B0085 [Bacillus cereus NVH0597-99]MDA2621263.1 hypothetical protein [Bacillus cereus]PES22315.1 hypothetical protein CN488_15020 [Bacillus anthracis]MDA1647574.1 hypothetical protein [Bacillus cereus group sp. TH163-1LC]MDA1797388.1 hypothetical protein [Bacillus cereus group sp. BY8-1LC]
MKKLCTILFFTFFLLILSSCGRDTSTLEKSIIGHWYNEKYNYHMYIDDKKITYITKDEKEIHDYTHLNSDDDKQLIELTINQESGIEDTWILAFTDSNKEEFVTASSMVDRILGSTDLEEEVLNNLGRHKIWKYVDDKVKP